MFGRVGRPARDQHEGRKGTPRGTEATRTRQPSGQQWLIGGTPPSAAQALADERTPQPIRTTSVALGGLQVLRVKPLRTSCRTKAAPIARSRHTRQFHLPLGPPAKPVLTVHGVALTIFRIPARHPRKRKILPNPHSQARSIRLFMLYSNMPQQRMPSENRRRSPPIASSPAHQPPPQTTRHARHAFLTPTLGATVRTPHKPPAANMAVG